MPTIADLYNLIVQATNAVIHAIHGVGLLIAVFGTYFVLKDMAYNVRLLADKNGWHRKDYKVIYFVLIVLAGAALGLAATLVF